MSCEPRLLIVREVGDRLRLSRSTVAELIMTGASHRLRLAEVVE